MAATKGNLVDDADYDALFTTLEKIRAKHVAQPGITSANKTKLQDTTLGGNVITVNAGTSVLANQMQKIFNAMDFLDDYAANLSGFAAKIPVPKAGDLLQATTITTAQTQLDNANAVCANCSFSTCFSCSHNGSWNSSWNGVVC